MKRWLFFCYGVGCHLLFLAIYAWLVAFVGNVLVRKSIDSPPASTTGLALAVNFLLLGLFAVQHSVMARPAFKRLWTRVVPVPIERSTYVLLSNLATILLLWQWRAMPAVVWNIEQPAWRAIIWSLFVVGVLLVPAVTFMLDHFELFGTRQVWLHLRGEDYRPLPFSVPLLYRWVRHPLYVGWTIFSWATPTMTAGHLLFAVVLTGYMALAAIFEERDLVAHFGRQYEDYRRRVPKFIPRWPASASEESRELGLSALSTEPEDCRV